MVYSLFQRKCWWDGLDVELPTVDGKPAMTVKLWARRVWTLELSLVSYHSPKWSRVVIDPF